MSENLFDTIKLGDTIKDKIDKKIYKVSEYYDNKCGVVLIYNNEYYRVSAALINSNFELANEHDSVNSPQHYTGNGVECIDAMVAAYGKEAVMHFCQCNAFKYQWRFDKKNGTEDLKKAEWYNNKYIELKDGNQREC